MIVSLIPIRLSAVFYSICIYSVWSLLGPPPSGGAQRSSFAAPARTRPSVARGAGKLSNTARLGKSPALTGVKLQFCFKVVLSGANQRSSPISASVLHLCSASESLHSWTGEERGRKLFLGFLALSLFCFLPRARVMKWKKLVTKVEISIQTLKWIWVRKRNALCQLPLSFKNKQTKMPQTQKQTPLPLPTAPACPGGVTPVFRGTGTNRQVSSSTSTPVQKALHPPRCYRTCRKLYVTLLW